MTDFTYDLALSFAGEDRDYVSRIADLLRSHGVRVFYDDYERANLLGKDLIDHLDKVYGSKSKNVAIFISKSYLTNQWTNHERKSALNTALKKINEEYIWPIRLDDTELPGLQSSISYLSAQSQSLQDIAEVLLEKLGKGIKKKDGPLMKLYRMSLKKYSIGTFTSKMASRWTKEGESVFFTHSSMSLALLENLAHANSLDHSRKDFCMTQYTIPASLEIEVIYQADLKRDWQDILYQPTTQEIGSSWYKKEKSCILSVPSAIIPHERCFLLNANHPDYSFLRIYEREEIEIDPRLFK